MGSEREIRIFLLGRFAVERGGEEIPAGAWKRKRPVDVLTELALAPGHVLHREELVDRLWPDKDLGVGSNNLHRALHDLRKIAGEEIASIDHGVIRLSPNVWIDVDQFENAIDAGDAESLERATALYRGDLLPEDPYSERLSARREALRQRFVDASLRLAQGELEASRVPNAIDVLRRLVAIDPAQEEARRMLIRALASSGRKHDAFRQYAECVSALREHLDAEPSPETRELFPSIQSGEMTSPNRSADWTYFARRLIGTDSPPVLRGRSEAISELESFVDRGRGVLFIIGEAGVGKTRLALESARLARMRDAVVLAGACYDFGSGAPYAAFIEGWNDHLHTTGASAENPFLTFKPAPGAPPDDRLKLFQSVEQSLRSMAGSSSVCFLIEDVHLADESSLYLIHYLARACRRLPLILVATCREEDVGLNSPLADLLPRLRRERLAGRIDLKRLTEQATSEQVADLIGRAPDEATLRAVYGISEGNPFFTEEVIGALRDDGAIELPDDLMAAMRQRVTSLGADAERLLATASVIGQRFEFETVRRAVDLSMSAALDALDRGLAARVVEEDGQGYRFHHALTRQALYGALTNARRVFLHRTVAEVIEEEAAGKMEDVAEVLAFHHRAAGQLDRAIPHLLVAGERAVGRIGYREAVNFYLQALELMDALGSPAGPERLNVLTALGGMLVSLGDMEMAVRYLDEAAALRDPATGWCASKSSRAGVRALAAIALVHLGDLDQAEVRLRMALDELEDEESSELPNVLYHFAQLRWHQGRYQEAHDLAHRLVEDGNRRGDKDALARGYEMLALCCHSLGEWQKGVRYEQMRQALGDGALDVAEAYEVHL